jgi:predicted ATPase/DNA-binding SARP family transcriptional activator
MIRLLLSVLGPLQATLDGQPVTGFESNKVRAMLAFLAVEAHRPHSRDALIGLLWPEQPNQVARNNLRQALANLRQAIGDRIKSPSPGGTVELPFLHVTHETIQFNLDSDYRLDVTVFTDLLTATEQHPHRHLATCKSCIQRLQQAIDLYRGDFLERFFVGDSPAFEEWILIKREELRRRALDTLYRLADYHERRGMYDQVLHYSTRQLELDPWREEAHRQVMRALAFSGQRSAALAQYETCRRVLAEELNAEPAKETTALYAEIKNGGDSLKSGSQPQAPALPIPTTPFIGRDVELVEIARLLENPACHLITIIGPGGIGKTRLALAAAAEQAETFAQGVAFVPLVAVSSSEFLAAAILTALGVSLQGQPSPLEQLLAYLREREMLLVLDNFEQLLDGLDVLTRLLQHAPQLTLLVTSRERLALQAEWLFDLEGLSYPIGELTDANSAYGAIELFVQRARQVQRQFTLTEDNTRAVARICQLVEGLPLAIELAAAAVRERSCVKIAREIESGLRVLTTSMRDIPERHRSLWAVFEHSWQLLSQEEQAILRRLSVFRGRFDGDAAAHAAGATSLQLSALVDKSLLRMEPAGRYDLHELVRQYAGEKLLEAGEVDPTRDLHLDYFLVLAERAEPQLYAAQQQTWLDRLAADHDNLREALGWALANRQVQVAARLGGVLARFWGLRGYLSEGRQWLVKVMALFCNGSPEAAIRARVLRGAGMLAWRQSDFDQAGWLMEESLALSREIGDAATISRDLQSLATVEITRGNYARGMALLEECLAGDRASGDKEGVAYDLGSLADLAFHLGHYTRAQDLYAESLALHRERNDKNSIAICLNNLGEVARFVGDYLQSVTLTEEAMLLFRELGAKQGLAVSLANLGELRLWSGDDESARVMCREALALQRELGAVGDIAIILPSFAAFALKAAEPQRASRLYAAAEVLRQATRALISAAQSKVYAENIATARAQLGEAAFSKAWAEGRAMTVERTIAYALTTPEE